MVFLRGFPFHDDGVSAHIQLFFFLLSRVHTHTRVHLLRAIAAVHVWHRCLAITTYTFGRTKRQRRICVDFDVTRSGLTSASENTHLGARRRPEASAKCSCRRRRRSFLRFRPQTLNRRNYFRLVEKRTSVGRPSGDRTRSFRDAWCLVSASLTGTGLATGRVRAYNGIPTESAKQHGF